MKKKEKKEDQEKVVPVRCVCGRDAIVCKFRSKKNGKLSRS